MRRKLMRYWPLLLCTVFCVAVGLVGYRSWVSPRTLWTHEFRGTLVYTYSPRRVIIPENPPPLAFLVTPTQTYNLGVYHTPKTRDEREFHRKLADLNGKRVIVRGRWTVYRNPFIHKPKPAPQWVISIQELDLDPNPAPLPARPYPPGLARPGDNFPSRHLKTAAAAWLRADLSRKQLPNTGCVQ